MIAGPIGGQSEERLGQVRDVLPGAERRRRPIEFHPAPVQHYDRCARSASSTRCVAQSTSLTWVAFMPLARALRDPIADLSQIGDSLRRRTGLRLACRESNVRRASNSEEPLHARGHHPFRH